MYHKYKKYSRNYIIRCFVPTCQNNTVNCPRKIFAVIIKAIKRKWCSLVKANYDPTRRMYCCEDHLNLGEDLDFFYYFKVLNVLPRLKRSAKLRYYVSKTQAINVFQLEEDEYEVPAEYSQIAGPVPSTSDDYQTWEDQTEISMAQEEQSYVVVNPLDNQAQQVEIEGEQSYFVLQPTPLAEQQQEAVMEVSNQQTYLVLQPPANTSDQKQSIVDLQQQIIVLQQQEMGLQPQMVVDIPEPQPEAPQEYYELQTQPINNGDQQQLMMQLQPYLDIHTPSLGDQCMLDMQSPADLVVQSQSVLDSEMEALEQQPHEPTAEAIATAEAELYHAMKQQVVLELQPQMAAEYVIEHPTHVTTQFKPQVALEQHAQQFIASPPPVLLEVQAAREMKTVGVNTVVPYPDVSAMETWAAKKILQTDAFTQYEPEVAPAVKQEEVADE